jgi:biopolymer transport protein ExbD
LAGLLVLAGCPSQQEVPSAVTILAAGTYSGNVDCTSTATGKADAQDQTSMTVEVSAAGQLYVSGLPYYEGAVQDMTDTANGITGDLTINTISEDNQTKTVTVAGTGTLGDGTVTYATTHDITLVQSSATQLQVTDDYDGNSAAASKSFDLTCGGTLTME